MSKEASEENSAITEISQHFLHYLYASYQGRFSWLTLLALFDAEGKDEAKIVETKNARFVWQASG